MDGLSLNSTHNVKTTLIAAIDSGTSLIYVPDRVADEFYGQVGSFVLTIYADTLKLHPDSWFPKGKSIWAKYVC